MVSEIKKLSGNLYRQHTGVLLCVFLLTTALHIGNRLLGDGIGEWVKSSTASTLLQTLEAAIGAILLLLVNLGVVKCLFGAIEEDKADFKQFLFAFSDKGIFIKAVLLGLFVYAPLAVVERLLHSGLYTVISYLIYGASLVFLFLIPYRFVRKPVHRPFSLVRLSVKRMSGNLTAFLKFSLSLLVWFLVPYAAHFVLEFIWFIINANVYATVAYESLFKTVSTLTGHLLTAAIAPYLGLCFAFYAKNLMGDYTNQPSVRDSDTRQF